MSAATEIEIDELGEFSIRVLRDRFRALYGSRATTVLGKDLMIHAVAHRIQERAEGGMSSLVQRRLNKLVRAYAETGQVRIDDGPAVKPGTRLIRDWQGQTHQVTVTDDGFIYRDQVYRSLSQIAREITGTRWSGPKFFGLQSRNKGP